MVIGLPVRERPYKSEPDDYDDSLRLLRIWQARGFDNFDTDPVEPSDDWRNAVAYSTELMNETPTSIKKKCEKIIKDRKTK